ncbi:hypothetical protein CBL_20323 [Carabus blaptoides fortunei]
MEKKRELKNMQGKTYEWNDKDEGIVETADRKTNNIREAQYECNRHGREEHIKSKNSKNRNLEHKKHKREGVEEHDRAAAGVAILVKSDIMDRMESVEYINEILMKIGRTTENKQQYTLIISYGPNEDDKIKSKKKAKKLFSREFKEPSTTQIKI